jgi:23S rRNA G2445 N2-methylase RlmL
MTIKCDTTIGVCQDRDLRHTHFSSLTVKNAVVDQFRDAGIARPSVDTENPDMILHTYLHRGKCTLYKVWSGEDSMHKRGYRDTVHRAALRETTAAGLILISGWNGEQSALVDPMCGSGTLAIEAALIATNTAPGLLRYGLGIKGSQETEKSRPSVVDWPHMSSHEWEDLWDEAARMDLRKDIYTEKRPPKIFINDLHPGALELALRSARSAKVDHLLDFSNEEAIDYQPRCSEVGMIVTNPPWDIRLGNAHEAWSQLGDFARRTLGTDSGPDGGVQRKRNMWCLSGNPKVVRYMNLEDSDRVALSAGKIDLRFLKYSF